MAVYKVPQDVEADDKLIGPFSFRQFVYIIIVVIAIAVAWGLSQLFIPLAIIPLPIIIFFGALALPLRKDQPMETYLAAIVSFYLKPRKRLWQPDGIQSLVEITAPKEVEIQRSKNLTQTEAEQRLSYLANIVDTGGWAVRGVSTPDVNSPMRTDAFFEAQQTEDVLDETGGVARAFDTRLDQADAKRHQEMMDRMRQPASVAPTPPPIADPYANLTTSSDNPFITPAAAPEPHVTYNPYPTSIHQTVINPLGEQSNAQPLTQPTAPVVQPATAPEPPQTTQTTPTTTSEEPVSPDIINLANNPDLSIETIAHEANRIHEKEQKASEEEVVISLR